MAADNHTSDFVQGVSETAWGGHRGTDVKETTLVTESLHFNALGHLDPEKDISINMRESLRSWKNTPGESFAVPLLDKNGNIESYRFTMDKQAKRDLLGINDDIAEVMAETIAYNERKIQGYDLNEKLFAELIRIYRNAKDKSKFIEVSPDENDKIWALIPPPTRDYIRRRLGRDERLHIHPEILTLVFGYQKASVTMLPLVRDSELMKYWLGWLERRWQEVVSQFKRDILIRGTSVVLGNIASNYTTLTINGLTPGEIRKYTKEAVDLMDDFQKNKSKLIQMRFRRNMGYKVDEVEYEALKRRVESNPVAQLVYRGEFQIIVEDFDVIEDIDSLVEKWGDDFIEKLPPKLRKVVKEMYMNKDTRLYQFIEKTFQYSDFAAKYAMWKKFHIIEGKPEKEVIEAMNDYFVDYAPPSNRYAQYLDDMGVFMFNKYFFRIGRGLYRMARTKLYSLLLHKTIEATGLFDAPDIYDTAFDFSTRVDLVPFGDLADIFVPDAVRFVGEVFD
jgi:hypothetical protein